MQNPESAFRRHLDRLNELVRDGGTLSGHERNCAFLNTQGERFATISAVSGLDFYDDARSPAVVDWDGDGDLDLWVANRTAPRLRMLRNELSSDAHFVSFKLEGVDCNRDAIGARVTVFLANDNRPIIKTLRAGEGFLSQSSKALHFGLGNGIGIEKVTVDWPDGSREEFPNLQADRHYTIRQHEKVATPLPRRSDIRLTPQKLDPMAPVDEARVVLSARIPVPSLRYLNAEQKVTEIPLNQGNVTLVNVWASWCGPCIEEISNWSSNAARLRDGGINVVLLSADELDTNEDFTAKTAASTLSEIKNPFPSGLMNAELKTRLQQIHDWPFARKIEMPIPTSFLFDKQGQLAIIYRGTVSVERLLADVRILDLGSEQLLARAIPFAGKWRRQPNPLRPLQMAVKLMDKGDVADAAEFVRRNRELLFPHREFALMAAWIGEEYAKVGKTADAIYFFNEAIRRDAKNLTVINNLAWQLAANPDARFRDPQKAIHWAERAKAITKGVDPNILDTVAVAYASAGDFKRAVQTAELAIRLAVSQSKEALAREISQRLEIFKTNRPYRDPSSTP